MSAKNEFKQLQELGMVPSSVSSWSSLHELIRQQDMSCFNLDILNSYGLGDWIDSLDEEVKEHPEFLNVIYTLGLVLYGLSKTYKDVAKIKNWLTSSQKSLKDKVPLDLLKSTTGATYVKVAVSRL